MLAHLVSGRYVKTAIDEPYTSGTTFKASRLLGWLTSVFSGRKRPA